jgi:hypothetical protein
LLFWLAAGTLTQHIVSESGLERTFVKRLWFVDHCRDHAMSPDCGVGVDIGVSTRRFGVRVSAGANASHGTDGTDGTCGTDGMDGADGTDGTYGTDRSVGQTWQACTHGTYGTCGTD